MQEILFLVARTFAAPPQLGSVYSYATIVAAVMTIFLKRRDIRGLKSLCLSSLRLIGSVTVRR